MEKYIMRNTVSNNFLYFASILILVWGVDFTLNISLLFPILAVNYLIMAYIELYPIYKYHSYINLKKYWPLALYWGWFFICTIRGISDIKSNITLKYFCDYLIAGLMSLFVFIPNDIHVYFRWIKIFWRIGFWLAIILSLFGVSHSFYFHYMLLIIPLWKYLSIKEKTIIVVVLLYSLRFLDPRAHLPKYFVEILIFAAPFFLLKDKIIKIIHAVFLLLPIALLTTGILGIFNPFDMESYMNTSTKIEQNGESFDATIDTRTVIYEDVITSAINHDYVWQGRNITNGNDSRFCNMDQRNFNESSVLNHFTKLGLIGLLLLFLIYVYSSSIAIYKSNNHWVKLVGLYVSFRWVIMWVEDPESFSSLYLTIWLMIGICMSEQFRSLSDIEINNILCTSVPLSQDDYNISC